ncbi:hypothetical protein EWW49_27595, partial [Pseudomonas syringae]
APALNFEDVLLTSLANDSGLYEPDKKPKTKQEEKQ